jgi:5'-nucleotidase
MLSVTTCFGENGTQGLSAFGVIEEEAGNDDYKNGCKVLFDKYYPIEIDPVLTEAEKLPEMVAWYTQVHELWYKAGITRETIPRAVAKSLSKVKLRPGFVELAEFAKRHDVPLLIFSAGVGDVIEELLKQKLGDTEHIGIVSNWMKWESEEPSAPLVGWSEPLVSDTF